MTLVEGCVLSDEALKVKSAIFAHGDSCYSNDGGDWKFAVDMRELVVSAVSVFDSDLRIDLRLINHEQQHVSTVPIEQLSDRLYLIGEGAVNESHFRL